MRVKTIGSLMPTRPDVVMVPPRGMRGLGEPPAPGPFSPPLVFESAGQVSLTWDNDKGWVPRSMALNPIKWVLGTFALGWLGGYLTWLALGRRGYGRR